MMNARSINRAFEILPILYRVITRSTVTVYYSLPCDKFSDVPAVIGLENFCGGSDCSTEIPKISPHRWGQLASPIKSLYSN